MAVNLVAIDHGVHHISTNEDARSGVVKDAIVAKGDAITAGVLTEINSGVRPGDAQMLDGNVVGSQQLDAITAGREIAAIQQGFVPFQHRAANRDPAVIGSQRNAAEQCVVPTVNVDDISRSQIVRVENGDETGHRRIGAAPRIRVVSSRCGVLVIGQVSVGRRVHIERVAVCPRFGTSHWTYLERRGLIRP